MSTVANERLICKLQDIPVLGARRVALKEREGLPSIAIFRNAEDEVFALVDECPHKKGPLSQGIVHGKSVTCPLHNWKIGFESGEAEAPDVGCVQTFAVHVRDGDVWLSV